MEMLTDLAVYIATYLTVDLLWHMPDIGGLLEDAAASLVGV